MENLKPMEKVNNVRLQEAMSRSITDSEARERHPALYDKAKSRPATRQGRTVPMQVLNMGMPRTGTMSMQQALNILGYSCWHGSATLSQISDCKLWNKALDAKFLGQGTFTLEDWDELLGSYSAVCADVPAVALADDLIKTYPDAKVIVVERDVEEWFNSFSTTLAASNWSPMVHRIADWDPNWLGAMRDMHMRWVKHWFRSRSKEEMDQNSRKVYTDHYAMVRRLTPPERLLVYKMGDGWEPICKFLGKEVPDCPFPHVNDGVAVWELIALIMRRGIRNGLWRMTGYAVASALAVALSWWLYGVYRS